MSFGAPLSIFNGGRSQGQSGTPSLSGDYPFLNLLKTRNNGWFGRNTTNNNAIIDPTWLDTDGYPLASKLSGTNGVNVGLGGTFLPTSQNVAIGNPAGTYELSWTVTGAGASDTVVMQASSNTTVSGSLTSTGNGTFKYVFTPTFQPFGFAMTQLNGTAHASDFKLTASGDWATRLAAGQYFTPQYKAAIAQGKFGVWRFMDWIQVNSGMQSSWATRKPLGFINWTNEEWRAAWFGGLTTNSGNDYALTTVGGYSWPGYAGGSTPVDKQTMHIQFNADATLVQNGTDSTLVVSSLSPITFTWPSNPIVNGDILSISGGAVGGTQIAGTGQGINYYAVNVSGNTFQVSLTPGGTALTSGSAGTYNAVTRMPTLALAGGTKYPIRKLGGNPCVFTSTLPVATSNGTIITYGTMVFDNDLKSWLKWRGDSTGPGGFNNCVPPEVCFQLCKELGMHPMWSVPGFALDPPTDYATSLATYNKNNNPGWMIPRYEAGNEVWNFLTDITPYCDNKGFAHWGTSLNDEYGLWTSVVGQAVAAVHGAGNLGITYDVCCGVQTDGGLFPFGSNPGLSPAGNLGVSPRLTAYSFVGTVSPTFSGYTNTAAYTWTSAILVANYTSPAQRGTKAELQNAFNYYNTNVGNPTAQLANLNNYVDSTEDTVTSAVTFTNGSANIGWTANPLSTLKVVQFSGGSLPANIIAGKLYYVVTVATNTFQVSAIPSGTAVVAASNGSGTVLWAPYSFTMNYFAQRAQGYQAWAASFGVNKMYGYEGGYSPDLLGPQSFYSSAFQSTYESTPEATAPTRANPCVVTINNISGKDNSNSFGVSNPQAGNPCVVGMLLCFAGTGMPELVNRNAAVLLSNAGATQTWTAHNLHVNEAVIFTNFNGTFPANMTLGATYFVTSVPTVDTFQFAATRGGTAITPVSNFTVAITSAYVVTAVGVGGADKVSIDVDSSGFAAPSGSMYTDYFDSFNVINNFRTDALLYGTHLNQVTIDTYNAFGSVGGSFASQYQFSGTHSVWYVIQPDIFGTQSQEFAGIVAYNA